MPEPPSYPGVLVEEVPGGARTVVGVPTAIAAFVGLSARGPVDQPVWLSGFADYERRFGRPVAGAELGHAVRQFFANGGTRACAVRVAKDATPARLALAGAASAPVLEVTALDAGLAGNRIEVRVDRGTRDPASTFDLALRLVGEGIEEIYRDLSLDPADPRHAPERVNRASQLVSLKPLAAAAAPDGRAAGAAANPPLPVAASLQGGSEAPCGEADLHAVFAGDRAGRRGIHALDAADLFNLLVLPGVADPAVLAAAVAYCVERRAFLVVDAPAAAQTPGAMVALAGGTGLPRSDHAAVYYPWVFIADPLDAGRPRLTPPSGSVAGLYARTDAWRGVWAAPAGTGATLAGVQALAHTLTDAEIAGLNPLGVNVLRWRPATGVVAWGARTLRGADAADPEYRYVAVRRLALHIEESIRRGTRWAVFEPNDERLWVQLRLSLGAFMDGLFRQGAFQGATPREAYLVQCGRETTAQHDLDRGVVRIVAGFAPLKPAEFVLVRVGRAAGQGQT